MHHELPSWFAADQTFMDQDGWYIGSREGFRVGPYPRRVQAEERSRGLMARLATCRDTGERVRVVRTFLREQNQQNGRQLRSGPSGEKPGKPVTGKVDAPPVRAGEEPRTWFRTNRFFAVGDAWFFSTRECVDVGPYASREEAERDAKRLLEILQDTRSPAEARLHILQFQSRPRLGVT